VKIEFGGDGKPVVVSVNPNLKPPMKIPCRVPGTVPQNVTFTFTEGESPPPRGK